MNNYYIRESNKNQKFNRRNMLIGGVAVLVAGAALMVAYQKPEVVVPGEVLTGFCSIDENKNVWGPGKCALPNDCRGARSCSVNGYCQGDSDCNQPSCMSNEYENKIEPGKCSSDADCRGHRYCNHYAGFCEGKSYCFYNPYLEFNHDSSLYQVRQPLEKHFDTKVQLKMCKSCDHYDVLEESSYTNFTFCMEQCNEGTCSTEFKD